MKIILAGICKNVEAFFPAIKNSFEQFLHSLKSDTDKLIFIIYENNSTDKTVKLFEQLEEDYPDNVSFFHENLEELRNNPSPNNFTTQYIIRSEDDAVTLKAKTLDNKPCQVELRALARNKLMELIESNKYNEYEHVIMFDFNKVSQEGLPVKKIIDTILADPFLDAVIGIPKKFLQPINSKYIALEQQEKVKIQKRLCYTYRDEEFLCGPEVLGEYFWSSQYGRASKIMKRLNLTLPSSNPFLNEHSSPVSVVACYCGLAIFQKDSIRGARYSAYPCEELYTLYTDLHGASEEFRKVLKDSTVFNQQFLTKLRPFTGSKTVEYLNRQKVVKTMEERNKDAELERRLKMPGSSCGCGDSSLEDTTSKPAKILFVNNNGFDYPIVSEHMSFSCL